MTPGTRIRAASAFIALLSLVLIITFSGYVGIAVTSLFICLLALRAYANMALVGERYRIARKYFVALGLIAFTISIYRNDWLLHSFVLSTLAIFIIFLLLARDNSVPLEQLVNKAG